MGCGSAAASSMKRKAEEEEEDGLESEHELPVFAALKPILTKRRTIVEEDKDLLESSGQNYYAEEEAEEEHGSRNPTSHIHAEKQKQEEQQDCSAEVAENEVEEEEECRTPTCAESKIPAAMECPGAPRKPRAKPKLQLKQKQKQKQNQQHQKPILSIPQELLYSVPDLDYYSLLGLYSSCPSKRSHCSKRVKIQVNACSKLFG